MNGIWKYSELLPQVGDSYKLTLGEGNTPLIKSRHIGAMLGLENLYFKLELINPSGSYKDRFAACAVSNLMEQNMQFCLATSSGNTGSALAAYCAAAGIKCLLAIVDGAPSGKIQQMQIYGAETIMIRDFGKSSHVTSKIFSGLKTTAQAYNTLVQISAYQYCPLGMSGVQTIAYEIAEDLPKMDGHVFVPAGGGGLTLAVAKGFQIWGNHNSDFKKPKIHCVQPEGNDTISTPLRNGKKSARSLSQSTTFISGLQVPNVIDGDEVVKACKALDGTGYLVTDETVYKYQRQLSVTEGIFCEPAGAVSVAGMAAALAREEIKKDEHIVCVITGHGFKDPASAEKMVKTENHLFNNTDKTLYHIESQIKKLVNK